MVGGVMSPTVIFCSQLTVLPQLSLAVHVRVMTFVLGQAPGASVSAYATSGLGSQLSVAVATPVAFVEVESVQATLLLAGQVMNGAVPSVTVIVWLLVADSLPQA